MTVKKNEKQSKSRGRVPHFIFLHKQVKLAAIDNVSISTAGWRGSTALSGEARTCAISAKKPITTTTITTASAVNLHGVHPAENCVVLEPYLRYLFDVPCCGVPDR